MTNVKLLLMPVILFLLLTLPSCTTSTANTEGERFGEFLDAFDDAIQLFVNGEPEPFMALWAQQDRTTLAGGLGGEIEAGWEAIGERLIRVSGMYGQFDQARYSAHRVAYGFGERFGYLVQQEEIEIDDAETGTTATRFYRASMTFERILGRWRIVHRQADLHVVEDGGLRD